RDRNVTGVQTCALPIFWSSVGTFSENIKRVIGDMWDNLPIAGWQKWLGVVAVSAGPVLLVVGKMITFIAGVSAALAPLMASITKIGRASCRERVKDAAG